MATLKWDSIAFALSLHPTPAIALSAVSSAASMRHQNHVVINAMNGNQQRNPQRSIGELTVHLALVAMVIVKLVFLYKKTDMNGMTLKNYAKHRFLQLCDRYRKLKATGLQTQEQKNEFIALSLEIHAAKGEVPKRYWKYANK